MILFIENLFLNIVKTSFVLEGRFALLEQQGNDLNTNTFDNAIQNQLNNLVPNPKKYPASFLMPPIEIIENINQNHSKYRIVKYFLTRTHSDTNGGISDINRFNNTSKHEVRHDWEDMRRCAIDFKKTLDNLMRLNVPFPLRPINGTTYIETVSLQNNDRLSGVRLVFELGTELPCTISDYDETKLSSIEIPELITHPIHKFNNGY